MRIDIYEPQAIWEVGQQPDQQDVLYPRKGETDEADRLFLLCDGRNANGTTSKNVVANISGYFKRYQTARGVLSDETLLQAISTALPTDSDHTQLAAQASLSMICLHGGGVTLVNTGRCKTFHIRPSEKRILFESRQRDKAELSDPTIAHVTDVQPGDYFLVCSDGLLEQMTSDDVCKFFSESGSDDKKRNLLRAATANNKDNHSALFFKVKGVVSEVGDELLEDSEERQTTTSNNVTKVVRPIAEEKTTAPQQSKSSTQQPKPSYRQLEPKNNYRQQRRVPGTYEEEHHSNIRMIILVVVIVVLAIAVGALWYFNSPSSGTLPADSTEIVSPAVEDTTAQKSEPADSAMIPDSALVEPEPAAPVYKPSHRTTTPEYTEPEEEETEPTEQVEENTVTEPQKPAIETPRHETEVPKNEPATSATATE